MLSIVTSDRRDRPLCLQTQTMAVGGQGPAPTLHLAVAAGTAPSLGPSRGWGAAWRASTLLESHRRGLAPSDH